MERPPERASNEGESNASNNPTENSINQVSPVTVLGNLVNEVMEAYSKFQPFLQEYHTLLMNDSSEPVLDSIDNRRQRFCNNVNDMLHLIGHLFHNLSDLHINLRDASPRNIRTMVPFQTIISATAIPIEANIQLPTPLTPSTTNNSASSSTSTSSTSNNINISSHNLFDAFTRPNQATANSTAQNNVPNLNNQHFNFMRFSNSIIPVTVNPINANLQSSTERGQASGIRSEANINVNNTPLLDSTQQQSGNTPNINNNTSANSSRFNVRPNNTINRQFQNNLLPFSSQISGDPYLVCNSVHFLNSSFNNNMNAVRSLHAPYQVRHLPGTSQRRRHPAGNHENLGSSNSTQINDFSRIVGEFITPLIQNTASEVMNNAEISLDNSAQESSNVTNNESMVSSSENVTETSGLLNQLLDSVQFDNDEAEVLREIFSLINSNDSSNGERLQRALVELGGDHSIIESTVDSNNSNSVLWNIQNIILSSMSLRDIVNLAMNQNLNEVFLRCKPKLQNYFQNSLLNNANPNNSNHEEDENRLLEILYKCFEEVLDKSLDDLKDKFNDNSNIDLRRSFQNMIKDHLNIFIKHVFSNDQDNWGSQFYEKLKNFRDQTIALCRLCFKDSNKTITDYLIEKFGTMASTTNNQAVRNFLQNFFRNQLLEIVASTNIESINRYICLKDEILASNKEENNEGCRSAIINSEFSDVLPNEWMPVISSDLQSQSNDSLTARHGFSDAYTNGMPSKRRKIIKSHEISSQELLKDVIRRTFSQMNFGGDAGERIIESLLKNKALLDLFCAQLDAVFINRLAKDSDFKNMLPETRNMETNNSSRKNLSCILKNRNKISEERFDFTRKRNGK